MLIVEEIASLLKLYRLIHYPLTLFHKSFVGRSSVWVTDVDGFVDDMMEAICSHRYWMFL